MNQFKRSPRESSVLVGGEAVVHAREQMRIRLLEGLIAASGKQRLNVLENGFEADVLREVTVEVAARLQEVCAGIGALELDELGHSAVVLNETPNVM